MVPVPHASPFAELNAYLAWIHRLKSPLAHEAASTSRNGLRTGR